MKRYLAGTTALLFLALTGPVLAQDRDYGHGDYNNGGYNNGGYNDRNNHNDRDRDSRPYYRDRHGHEWHQGDTWNGHRLMYNNGRWGYYQPRGGSQVWVQFSL